MSERVQRLDEFFQKEFPLHVKRFYDEFSSRYSHVYKPVGTLERENRSYTLFEYLKHFIGKNYDIEYRIDRDFSFLSSEAFLKTGQEFGFGQGTDSHGLIGITGLSKIIKDKVKNDLGLEIELIRQRLRSYLKRFFIQGCVDWELITADQLLAYGVDKFPNSLDHEFDHLEYSIGFFEKYGLILLNGGGEKPTKAEKLQYEREKEYYERMKRKKKSEYSYLDILERIKVEDRRQKGDIVIQSKRFKDVPFMTLKKKGAEHGYSLKPYEFQFRFKINFDEVIKDEALLYECLQTFNEPENFLRTSFGLPKIGEGWISETNLFYELKSRFPDSLVVQHARPKWLGKQHLDIYFQKYNIAVEYQGDQHFFPVEFFGGVASFEKNVQRDEKKRVLCTENDCRLIYVKPNYSISDLTTEIEEIIRKRHHEKV